MRARSLKRQAADRAYEPVRQAILARDPRCTLCGNTTTDVHHRKQRSLGGTNDPCNLVGLCRTCHSDVHDEPGLYTALGLLLSSWESEAVAPAWHNGLGFWGIPEATRWIRWGGREIGDATGRLKVRLDERGRLFSKVHDSIPWETT